MPTPAATALADQLTAAVTHAQAVITEAARACGTKPITAPRSRWLAHQVRQLHRAITTGRARACPHLHSGPQIIHAAVWAPWHLTCTTCAPALRPDPTEDTTCDRCRAVGRPLHAGVLAIGPVILGYGLCGPCATTTGLHAPGSGTTHTPAGTSPTDRHAAGPRRYHNPAT